MRRPKSSGGFFLTFFLNLLLNFEWLIPGFVLMGLYIWLRHDWLLWCMIGAFALFFIYILGWTIILKVMNKGGSSPTPYRENKNPYSQNSYTPTKKD